MNKEQALQILVVSQNEGDFRHLQALLTEGSGSAANACWAQDVKPGQQAIQAGGCAAVLVSRDLANEKSLEFIRETVSSSARTPVILLASEALSTAQLVELDEAAQEAGAAGLLTWDELAPARLWRTLRYAIRVRSQPANQVNETPDAGSAANGLEEIRQALQTERDRLAFLLDSINDEVWVSDLEGNLTLLNNRAAQHLGFDAPEELNISHTALLEEKLKIYNLDGQLRPVEDAPLFRSLKGETVRGQEMVYHLKTGQPLYREFISSPIRDHTGQVVGAIAIGRDITEQKLAEDRLRTLNQSLHASQEKYRTLLESLQEGIWLLDENMNTVFVNDRMAAMLGYTVAEMTGQPLSSFLHPDELLPLEKEWARRMAGLPGQIDP